MVRNNNRENVWCSCLDLLSILICEEGKECLNNFPSSPLHFRLRFFRWKDSAHVQAGRKALKVSANMLSLSLTYYKTYEIWLTHPEKLNFSFAMTFPPRSESFCDTSHKSLPDLIRREIVINGDDISVQNMTHVLVITLKTRTCVCANSWRWNFCSLELGET